MSYWMIFLAISIIQILSAVSCREPQRVIVGIFMLMISGVAYYLEED